MIDAISGAWSSLSAAKDIAKGLMEMKETAAVNAKAIELNNVILDVQDKLFHARTEQSQLQDRIRDLELSLAKTQDFDRYELITLDKGGIVFQLKAAFANGEPFHFLCPNCHSKGMKSILQHRVGGLGCTNDPCSFFTFSDLHRLGRN